jgi:large subunit ribosomal protein L22
MPTSDTTPRTQALAHLKFARMGPRKLRRVADAIRGRSVQEALTLLRFSGVFAAEPMEKLLRSAIANAENNHNMAGDLYVVKVTVDGGPGGGFTKRLDPRAQGRAAFKRKRMSHVTIAVGSTPPKKVRRVAGASIVVGKAASRTRPSAPPPPARAPRTRKKKEAAAAAGASA